MRGNIAHPVWERSGAVVTASPGSPFADVSIQTTTTSTSAGIDCGSTQVRPPSGVVTEIWVPQGFYDVAATFSFGLTLNLPPGE